MQPIEKDVIDKELLALMNGESHADAGQVVDGRNGNTIGLFPVDRG
jgi:hypothetical protein